MNEQYFDGRFKPSDSDEGTDNNTSSPVDAPVVHETAMGGTVASVGPLSGPVAAEIPMFETPLQEIPMGGTLAAVGPMYRSHADVPVVETPVAVAPMVEPVAAVDPMNEPIVEEIPVVFPAVALSPLGGVAAVVVLADEKVVHEVPMDETPTNLGPKVEANADGSPVIETTPFKPPLL